MIIEKQILQYGSCPVLLSSLFYLSSRCLSLRFYLIALVLFAENLAFKRVQMNLLVWKSDSTPPVCLESDLTPRGRKPTCEVPLPSMQVLVHCVFLGRHWLIGSSFELPLAIFYHFCLSSAEKEDLLLAYLSQLVALGTHLPKRQLKPILQSWFAKSPVPTDGVYE